MRMRASRGDGVERKAITITQRSIGPGRPKKLLLRCAKASVGPCGGGQETVWASYSVAAWVG